MNARLVKRLAKLQYHCSRTERCSFDLTQKLKRENFSSSEVEWIIDKLIDDNFINNERYADAFANDHFKFKSWGRNKIKSHLYSKRIPSPFIEKAIKRIDEEEYLLTIQTLIQQKKAQLIKGSKTEKKAKIVRYMTNKGFEISLLSDYLGELS